MKKILTTLLLAITLVGTTVHAVSPDWYGTYINEFSAPTHFPFQQRLSTSTFAFLTGDIDGFGGHWTYIKPNTGLVFDPGTEEQGTSNYQLRLDLATVDPMSLGNLPNLLDGKVSTTTYSSDKATIDSTLTSHTGSISTIISMMNVMGTTNNDMYNNIFGTSTGLHMLTVGTTTSGLMTRADKLKLDSLGGTSTRIYATTTRSFNSAFQVSTTTDAEVRYTVQVANVLTLTGGAAGDVILEYADNSGFTTNVVQVGGFGNSNTGGLVVGLTLNDAIKGQVSGRIPAGKYVRLRTVNTTGTPTYTFVYTQEVK